jgi:hypothetical protein
MSLMEENRKQGEERHEYSVSAHQHERNIGSTQR